MFNVALEMREVVFQRHNDVKELEGARPQTHKEIWNQFHLLNFICPICDMIDKNFHEADS